MKITATKTVNVDAQVIKLHLKVSDCFTATVEDADGAELADYEGYVPDFMPGEHHGDYVILDINIDTGQILNWTPPSVQQLEAFIQGEDDQ